MAFLFAPRKGESIMIQQGTRSTPRLDLGIAFHEFTPEGMTFAAERALPTLDVAKEAATIGVITRENARTTDNKHTNGAAYGRVHLGSEDKSYSTGDYGLEGQLTDHDRERFLSDYDAEVEMIQLVKTHMLMAKEIRAAAALFDTTTWTGSDLYTDVSSAPWDTAASAVIDPVASAVEQVRKNTGIRADTMLIGPVTYKNLKANTGILAKFSSNPSVLTAAVWRQYLAEVLDLAEIIVADGVYNSAAEGQTASMADVWSDDYALIFKRQSGSIAMPGLGRTLRWMGQSGSLINGLDNVERYREEQTKSDIFRVTEYVGEFICDAYFGHLLKID
jgi:hypothetical protein